jgi:hypothetical protein
MNLELKSIMDKYNQIYSKNEEEEFDSKLG